MTDREGRLMKRFSVAILLISFFMNIYNTGYAEYIFKKDGAIVKGSIVRDEATTISIKKEDNTIEKISRSEIMRIIYTELFLGKVYIRLTSGEIVEGYIVDENRDEYFVRKDLYKPEEIKLPRKKVMFISRTNPTDINGKPSTESIEVTWSPPFKPAKKYKVYVRDVHGKQEKFRMDGETSGLSHKAVNLQKSWIYEIYATAISATGEESLPSEKIIVNTLPEPPENLIITETPGSDSKHVTLVFGWITVNDPLSRVKSYTIYEIMDDGKTQKKGTSPKGEFVIKNFPAEGRHKFAVVAVNDLDTESDEIRGIYDAGYKIYLRGMVSYIYPMGIMSEMATSGYGLIIDAGLSAKRLSLGIETGYIMFSYTEDINSMVMVPLLLELGYRLPLSASFSIRPVIKAGFSYDMITYVVHDEADPLITGTSSGNSFDPMLSAGAYLQYEIMDRVDILGGAEYSMIFEKKGTMKFVNILCGASFTF
jgi:hypothetical protein